MKTPRNTLATSLLAVAVTILSAGAAVAGVPTAQTIEQLVNGANILKPGYKIQAFFTPGTTKVGVQTWMASSQTKDSKIDALLVSQKILDSYPSVSVVTVRIINPSQRAEYLEYSVTAGDVAGFAKGGLEKDRLLDSIVDRGSRLKDAEKEARLKAIKGYQPVEGSEKERRQSIFANIVKIQQMGGDPTSAWEKFLTLEAKAVKGFDPADKVACQKLDINTYNDASEYSLTLEQRQSKLADQAREINAHSTFNYTAADGLYKHERQYILNHIRLLAAKQQSVQSLLSLYDSIEKLARLRRPEVLNQILLIERQLDIPFRNDASERSLMK